LAFANLKAFRSQGRVIVIDLLDDPPKPSHHDLAIFFAELGASFGNQLKSGSIGGPVAIKAARGRPNHKSAIAQFSLASLYLCADLSSIHFQCPFAIEKNLYATVPRSIKMVKPNQLFSQTEY
jgi:hypothetical protein